MIRWLLMQPVRFYRRFVSPLKPACCRFRPTCSAYALEALQVHGALRGTWLTIRRIVRCQPFCEPGFDPVPEHRERPTRTAATDRSPPR
ncbi:MAG: membrane protein insertion efficiency factor YidD [Planctomycetes bacterium]|nr:membrane protein insertion efficiency factor YidD [Planctomycetota bacterium]